MTGHRSELVLLPQLDEAGRSDSAFELWLEEAGWDSDRMELRPPANHPTFGYLICAVESCGRVAWGQANQGMCSGCASAWMRVGRPALEQFLQQSPNRERWHHIHESCAVERNGIRCARPVRQNGLCSKHFDAVKTGGPDHAAALATLEPLETLGKCRVASCHRLAGSPTYLMCYTHVSRWVHQRKTNRLTSIEAWCRTERPVGDSRCVTLAGLTPLVTRQILFGVYNRSRRGSHTRLEALQRVVDFLRHFESSDLKTLGDIQIPPKWPKSGRPLLRIILTTAQYAGSSPEQFRHNDIWPGYVFGRRGSQLDFRTISQTWLRELTQGWCWDNLNRFDDFSSFIKVVNEVTYFSEYLRTTSSAGGEDVSTLNRTAITGFAEYVATLVRNGDRRNYSKRPGLGDRWTPNMQSTCLFAVQRVLRYGRETDQMRNFAGSFMITDDILVRNKPLTDRDGPGDALPVTVMRQLFSDDNLKRLAAMNQDLPRMLRIAAETGRRPGELVTLKYSCLDLDSPGGPYLVYTESKVTRGQLRRLPVLDVVVRTAQAQQVSVRQRFPDTPLAELSLFPRSMMNPRGIHPFSSATYGKNLRNWVDALPLLVSDDITANGTHRSFDRKKVVAYSFRHTYAQRHADAGTSPDVLRELMGHEQIETTMGYYRIPQKRRREAAEIVGNLVIDGDSLVIGSMGHTQQLTDQRTTVAVPFGKCSNPQNVAAEGYGCPIRHQCFGCASFSSDPSYLPEMRRRLLDLKATRARVDAFRGATEWAKRDARPSDEEIDALDSRIRGEEDKLGHATEEQRTLITNASAVLRKARAVGQAGITLRRPNGEDALLPHVDDRRHAVDILGRATSD